MSEHAASAAPEPQSESNTATPAETSENAASKPQPESDTGNSRSSDIKRGVATVLKFLECADGNEIVNIGLLLTNAMSPYARQDYAPIPGLGKVTKWFPTRGFGFIQSEGSSEDLFVHMTEIEGKFNALAIGKTVSFIRAFNIQREKFQATKISGEGCIRAKINRSRGVCFDFQKGTCTRGANCRFSHTRGNGGRGGRGRGYNRRGRGRYANPYGRNYGGGMYGMPYGNGYGMGVYGGFPVMGYGGGYAPPFPLPGGYAAPGTYGMYHGQQNDSSSSVASPMSNGETSPAPSSAKGTGFLSDSDTQMNVAERNNGTRFYARI